MYLVQIYFFSRDMKETSYNIIYLFAENMQEKNSINLTSCTILGKKFMNFS